MPNWCYNTAAFSHKDPAQVARLKTAFEQENLFREFVPCPQELLDASADGSVREELVAKYGYSDWYGWSVANWGTKWDIAVPHISDDTDPNTLIFSFETAWSPPIAFYEKMVDMGWEIDAEYTEEGMGFVGYFTNEEGEEYYDLNFDEFDEDWKEQFPERLHETLEMQYELWLDWQEHEHETQFKDEIGC